MDGPPFLPPGPDRCRPALDAGIPHPPAPAMVSLYDHIERRAPRRDALTFHPINSCSSDPAGTFAGSMGSKYSNAATSSSSSCRRWFSSDTAVSMGRA